MARLLNVSVIARNWRTAFIKRAEPEASGSSRVFCRETAPSFFTRNDEGGYSYVQKQPTTEEEIAQCMEALEGCPVEAIGNDGDE